MATKEEWHNRSENVRSLSKRIEHGWMPTADEMAVVQHALMILANQYEYLAVRAELQSGNAKES